MTETVPQSASAQMIKKTAGKGKATKKAVETKASDIDLIVSTVVEIENMSRDAAVELGHELLDSTDFNYFKLGGIIAAIQENGWFKEKGFDHWPEFINQEYGIGKRKAQYMVQIYNGLVESGVKWDQVAGLGWTKIKELSHILTKDNAAEWVEKAKNMTVMELQEAIKAYKTASALNAQTGDDEQAEAQSTGVTTLTFKVHADQKETITEAVKKGMGELDTEYKAVALEAICMQYLGGDAVKTGPATKPGDTGPALSVAGMHDMGWEAVLNLFDEAFPDIEITVKV